MPTGDQGHPTLPANGLHGAAGKHWRKGDGRELSPGADKMIMEAQLTVSVEIES